MTKNAITTIPFHNSTLYVLAGETPETTMVAMKPVVDDMSLEWSGQRQKLERHPVLSTCTVVTPLQMPGDDQTREHTFLPLNRFHFWLATIQPNRITDFDIREKVIVFQTEAADVLFDHFFGRAIGHGDDHTERHFGISKMTIGKVTKLEKTIDALTNQVNALIINTDSRVAALEYVSVRELLEEAKAVQKRRGRVNRKIGWELRERALVGGPPNPCRKCPHSDVWLFQRDFAAQYMKDRGASLVADHNASQLGQGVINFPRSGKGAH